MRLAPLSLGRPFGIRLRLHPSWFLILILIGTGMFTLFRDADPGLRPGTLAVMALFATTLFFTSLVAHEMGHALLARRLGIPVRGITLFLFGGVSEISQEVPVARDEFAIALVGPMISVLLAGLFQVASIVAGHAGSSPVEAVAAVLSGVNGVLAVFNLVPGLPLDGGRLLRSAIWGFTGNRARSTAVAVACGRVAALGLFLWGVVRVVRGDVFGLWFAFVAFFLDGAARASGRSAAGVALRLDEGSPAEPGA